MRHCAKRSPDAGIFYNALFIQADVDAPTLLVNALPANIAPATDKQDLLDRLAAIQIL